MLLSKATFILTAVLLSFNAQAKMTKLSPHDDVMRYAGIAKNPVECPFKNQAQKGSKTTVAASGKESRKKISSGRGGNT